MSSETRAVDAADGPEEAARGDLASANAERTAGGRARRRAVAGGALAACAVGFTTVLGVLHNVPFDPLPVSAGVLSAVEVGAAVVVALALGALAAGSRRTGVRIGLLFVAVFGALAALSPAARVPAAVAVTAGGALALGSALGVPDSYREVRQAAVAAGFLVAVALSLAGTLGVGGAGFRELGVLAFLVALVSLTVRLRGDRVALVAGAVAFAAVVAGAASAPFVAGSALLVGFGVVGGPHVLVAAAVGGAVAAAVAGVRRGDFAIATGAAVLVFAGVPATPTAAMAVLLGATLALVDPAALAGVVEPEDGGAGPEVAA
jgi:hypothetical protein